MSTDIMRMHTIKKLILLCVLCMGCQSTPKREVPNYALSQQSALQLAKRYLVQSYGASLYDSSISGRPVLNGHPLCAEPYWTLLFQHPARSKFLKGYYVIVHRETERIHAAGEMNFAGNYLSKLIKQIPTCQALEASDT